MEGMTATMPVTTMPVAPIGYGYGYNNNYDCGCGCMSGGNQWFWLIILFLFSFGGFGGNRFGANSPDFQGYATRSDIHEGFQFNQLENGQRAIERGICDSGYATQRGFNETQVAMLQGFNGVDRSLCCGFNEVGRGLAENRFAQQECCCETNRNIDAVRAENYKNTCEITTAIHAEGEATRALINHNTMQDLRDKLEQSQRENLTNTLISSNQAQTMNLVNTLRPYPTPAYITCSPYVSNWNNWNNCGGCGCNWGCGC